MKPTVEMIEAFEVARAAERRRLYDGLETKAGAARIAGIQAVLDIVERDREKQPNLIDLRNEIAQVGEDIRRLAAATATPQIHYIETGSVPQKETTVLDYDRAKETALWTSDMEEVLAIMKHLEGAPGIITGELTVVRDDGEELAILWFDTNTERWLCNWKAGSGA